MPQTVTYVGLDSDQGQNISPYVAVAAVFLRVTSSHLAARLALLLCVDVDGGLVHTCERVVPWIVSGGVERFRNGLQFDRQFQVCGNKSQ